VKSYGYKNQIGYGQEYSEYLDDLKETFRKIFAVTKDTGSLWIIVDTFSRDGKLINLPGEISKRLINCKWNLVDVIIWKKDKTSPWPKKGRLRNIFEYVFFFAKTDAFKFYADRIRVAHLSELKEWWVRYPERYSPRGKLPTNVWEYPIPTQGSWGNKHLRHSNPLPPKLIKRILLLTTDKKDVVLDPFAGSGTVLAVADFMNRRWLGFEMNEKYCGMFKEHVLSEIKETLSTEEKREAELNVFRKKFEETIKNLRLVKYPKSLIRECNRKKILDGEGDQIDSVFAISREPTENELFQMPRHKFMVEDIFLIFDGNIETKVLADRIREVASKAPLTKFGIDARVFPVMKDKFVLNHRNEFDSCRFWLYTCGTTHSFERQMTFSQWLIENKKPKWEDYFRNGIPPIMSNVRVKHTIPKTWKSQEERFNMLKHRYNKMIGS